MESITKDHKPKRIPSETEQTPMATVQDWSEEVIQMVEESRGNGTYDFSCSWFCSRTGSSHCNTTGEHEMSSRFLCDSESIKESRVLLM